MNQTKNTKQGRLFLAHRVIRFAANLYRDALSEQKDVGHYLAQRGITPSVIQRFHLGATPRSKNALSAHLITKSAPIELAVELGLIRHTFKRQHDDLAFVDTFRNRVIFPVFDSRGKITGFGGRIIPSHASEEEPKYLNSPESMVFQKDSLVFGFHQAKNKIREVNEVILVDGYFDVISMHSAGFENVVATCGTSVTAEHLHLFSQTCSKVTLLLEDQAIHRAASQIKGVGTNKNYDLHCARLPEGQSLNQILLEACGVQKMHELLVAAHPFKKDQN